MRLVAAAHRVWRYLTTPEHRRQGVNGERGAGSDQIGQLVDEYRAWLAAKRAAIPPRPTDGQTIVEIHKMIKLDNEGMLQASRETEIRLEVLRRAEDDARAEYAERFQRRIEAILPESSACETPVSIDGLDAIGQELERVAHHTAADSGDRLEVDERSTGPANTAAKPVPSP